jgi:hypothetical protein
VTANPLTEDRCSHDGCEVLAETYSWHGDPWCYFHEPDGEPDHVWTVGDPNPCVVCGRRAYLRLDGHPHHRAECWEPS